MSLQQDSVQTSLCQDDFNKLLKLLNRNNPGEPFNVTEIEELARELKVKYTDRAEPFFYLARMYRNIGDYKKAAKELKEIQSRTDWSSETPKWILNSEILFEDSLLLYYEGRLKESLRRNIEYINDEECINEIFALDNLKFMCRPLSSFEGTRIRKMNLPSLGPYHPSSVNHVDISGEDCLCVRYVNYNILDSGEYDCNEFSTCNMILYKGRAEILENKIELPRFETKYHGIEDIRLYKDATGTVRFVGTQQEWVQGTNINRIMRGKLDFNTYSLTEACVIESPFKSECEKNWIPWINSKGDELFIYWWWPFQIGRLHRVWDFSGSSSENNTNTHRSRTEKEVWNLAICYEQKTPNFFSYFRGSSCPVFIPNLNEYWAVVHFVHTPMDNGGTRRYYHCLVIFKENKDGFLEIVDYTIPFTFILTTETKAIEYCLGFHVCKNSYLARFWFSCMDSNPHILEIPLSELEKLRQGSI